jgi:hypothetical protein
MALGERTILFIPLRRNKLLTSSINWRDSDHRPLSCYSSLFILLASGSASVSESASFFSPFVIASGAKQWGIAASLRSSQ